MSGQSAATPVVQCLQFQCAAHILRNYENEAVSIQKISTLPLVPSIHMSVELTERRVYAQSMRKHITGHLRHVERRQSIIVTATT